MKQILLITLLFISYFTVAQCDSLSYERYAGLTSINDSIIELKLTHQPNKKFDNLNVQLFKFNKESAFNPNIEKWSYIGNGAIIKDYKDGFKIKIESPNKYNLKGLKPNDDIKLYWQVKAKVENILKIENNDTLYYGKIFCNNKIGTWKYFYPNNKLKNITNYNQLGELDGIYKIFHKDGGYLYETGNYKNGKLNGTVYYYYEDGKVKKEIPFVNGKRDGIVTKYYPNGNIQYVEQYKDGKICCQAKDYYESGKLKIITNYKNGKIDSTYTYFFENGNIKSKVNYNEGKRDGEAVLYYENGNLKEKSLFINNKYVGDFISYYENGNIKAKGQYTNGKKFGLWKQYYENGKKKSIGKFAEDGSKTGKWKDWDENGKKTKSNY
jgi:antitoxin component YwqK of YwqJK toxin-antitoxin module